MHVLEKKIKKAELAYENNSNGRNALVLFARYVLAGKTIDCDGEGVYLSKAHHVAVTAHNQDLLDIKLISAQLYADMLLGNLDGAHELIHSLEAHGSFLSKNEPVFYGQVLYFNSIIQAKTEKARSAKKINRSLELLYEKTGRTELIALLGSLQRFSGDSGLCAKMYLEALKKGLRSVFFMIDMYEMLIQENIFTSEMNELAKSVIPWALSNELPVEELIARLEKRTLIGILFSLNTRYLSKIYEQYGHAGAFQCLCQKLIFEGDTTNTALSHYVAALNGRLNLRGLEQISVKAAYVNKYYNLPLYVVAAALETPSEFTEEELAFLYATIMRCDASSEKNGDAAPDESLISAASNFGKRALSEGMRGTDFNIIYLRLLELSPFNLELAGIVFDELFKYEITFGRRTPSYVCTYEYAKKGIYAYSVEGNKCTVRAAGKFGCYFLGEDSNEYLSITDYKITRMMDLENAAKAVLICERLYDLGFRNADILLALAAEYLASERLTRKSVDILQRAEQLEVISDALRLEICSRLSAHYAELEHYDPAVHYYDIIGPERVKAEFAAGALNALMSAGRCEDAVALITKKRGALSEQELFNSLKVLHKYADTLEAASICFGLILNGYYSPEILGVVLRRYKGTSDEWLALANKVDSLGFDVLQLYEKIIINGIFTGSIGNDCNESFAKLYAADEENPVICKYAYFCCFEIIRNGKSIPDEIADILYDMYIKDDSDAVLCHALAINYIRKGRQDMLTLISESAALLEDEGLMLPELKQYQDKSFISSYIEKNTAFFYYSSAHKNVFFNYRSSGMASVKKKMSYFRFGIYVAIVPLFCGESITYFFEEENGAKTEHQEYVNNHIRIIEQFDDPFYTVNNAVIYQRMMKFDMVEALIEEELGKSERFPIITL